LRKSVVEILTKPEIKGIILDVRNNPGGFLEVAVNVTGWFVNAGEVVTKEQFRNGDSNVFRANGNGALKHIPIVVLVNEGSASASEILAGALRDIRGAPLVGQTTFGKGSVQELVNITSDTSLKITIARWLTPKGASISETGIEPEYKIEYTLKDREADRDPQMDKAIEILLE